jgi:MFS transporter, SHS family, sialic acid transporter
MAGVQRTEAGRWYRSLTRTQWRAFAASWLGYLLDGFDFVLITLVLTEIQDDFGISTVEAAALVSGAFVTRWIGGLALGALGDARGRRTAMIASISIFSIGSLLCALAPGYWALMLARMVVGFGMAGEYGASSAYVIESWPAHLRNKASAFLISGFSIGAILAAQAYGWIVPQWGWRALFAVGLLPILLALVLRRAIPEPPDWKAASGDERDIATTLFRGPRRLTNILLGAGVLAVLLAIFSGGVHGTVIVVAAGVACAAVFIWYMIQAEPTRWPTGVAVMGIVFVVFFFAWPVVALLPTYLKTEVGLDPGQVTTVLSYSGLGTSIGAVLAGFVGDRFGTARTYVTSLAVSIPLLFPVFLLSDGPAALLWVVVFLQMMVGQGVGGLLPKWMAGHFSVEKRAASLGFTYNVGALGGAISPVVGATLAESMSLGTAILVLSSIFTAVVVLLVALQVPHRLQRAIYPEAVWPTDGTDEMPQAVH